MVDEKQRVLWRTSNRRYYLTHKVETAKRCKAYKAAHPEKRRCFEARDRKRHRSRVRAQNRRADYKRRKSPKRIAYLKKYRLDNKTRIVNQIKKWQMDNQDRLRGYEQARRAAEKGVTVNPGAIKAFISMLRGKLAAACYYCQGTFVMAMIHVDHVIPIARGGLHAVENLCTACAPCNLSRKDKLVSEWDKLPQLLLPV